MNQTPHYRSHRDIIDLWAGTIKNDSCAAASDVIKQSCFVAMALDVTRAMGGIRCTYFKVYRWYERNTIPVEYHDAVVTAAACREFPGVTHEVLAGIKAREYAERNAAKTPVDKSDNSLTLTG